MLESFVVDDRRRKYYQCSAGRGFKDLQRAFSDGVVQRDQEGNGDGERWKNKLGRSERFMESSRVEGAKRRDLDWPPQVRFITFVTI